MINAYSSIHKRLSSPQSVILSLSRILANQLSYLPMSFYIFLLFFLYKIDDLLVHFLNIYSLGEFPFATVIKASLLYGHDWMAWRMKPTYLSCALYPYLCLIPDLSFLYFNRPLLGSPDPNAWWVWQTPVMISSSGHKLPWYPIDIHLSLLKPSNTPRAIFQM